MKNEKLKKLNRWGHSLQTKSTLTVLITTAVFIELTSIVQYEFARRGIKEEVQHRAESELRVKNMAIRNVLTAVEVALNNTKWIVEQRLDQPDTMGEVLQQLVLCNDVIVGCATAFEPNVYPEKGRFFEPYAKKEADGQVELKQIGSEKHNYLELEWYQGALNKPAGHWSEPYYDDAGAEMMLCSYALPINDADGRVVGVLGADVSLDWLGAVINSSNIYPSSYSLMISRTGQLMACSVESLVLRSTIHDLTAGMSDTTVKSVNSNMLSGKNGQATITDDEGNKNYVFYAPVEDVDRNLGWSMAVVCSDNEIYRGLRQVGFNLLLLMFVGLGLLTYLMFRMIRAFKHLQDAQAEKERIASELHIASAIQMSMVPKIFPPYPERDDVDIAASLLPAKEVGGDLYDFFIRDEKLFFCIGDVSGKGVPASLVMAVTRSLFRIVSAHEAQPERIVTAMNDSMADMNESNMFVTFFLGVLDLPTGRLRYCNAGHDAPLLVGKRVGQLPVESNIPLGVMPGWKYKQQDSLVDPDTIIFLYTDGLTEAEAADHRQFGLQKCISVARKTIAAGPPAAATLMEHINEAVKDFVGEAEQSDDLTMMALKYTKRQLNVLMQRSITLSNDVKQVEHLAQFVDEVCEAMHFGPQDTMQLNLALEEAVVNVMSYAYPAGTKGDINIEAEANDRRLKFIVSDSGVPFDPTAKEEVDTSLSVEERPIGGLGIHLVRQIMDSINYERVDGKNILTLRKKIK